MSRIIALIKYLFCILIISSTSTAMATTASQDLAASLSSFHSMTAKFTQTLYNTHGRPTQKSQGLMALERPGKFRWDTTYPNPQLLIADGRYLWIYDKDLQQATRQPLNSNNSQSPASLLSGSIENLEQRFSVSRLNQSGGDWFSLRPIHKNDIFQSVELHFINNKLADMRLHDNLGSISSFQFKEVQLNHALNPKLFRFAPPKGVEVIKN